MKNLQQLVGRGISQMAGLPGACQSVLQEAPQPYHQPSVSTSLLIYRLVLPPTPAALAMLTTSSQRTDNLCFAVNKVKAFRPAVRPIESP